MVIELLQKDFITASINENDHFLQAVNISNQYQTNIVPVINFDKELVGTISGQTLLKTLGDFSGSQEIGGIIVLEMERNQFTISEISRIVESNEALVLHLNTTIQPETGLLRATIHINKKNYLRWLLLLSGMNIMLFIILVRKNLRTRYTAITAI